MKTDYLQKYDCDRCGFTYKKNQLVRERGLLVCSTCRDDIRHIKPVKTKWFSPRDNSTTTTAINTWDTVTLTSAGITALSQVYDYEHEGSRSDYYMIVSTSAGALNLSSIVAGNNKDRLTLRGGSNSNYLVVKDNTNIFLKEGLDFNLKEGDTLGLVYNSSAVSEGWGYFPWGTEDWGGETAGWYETSRQSGGI